MAQVGATLESHAGHILAEQVSRGASQQVAARFYGPCDPCRDQLRATLGGEQRELEKVIYETKINVVPNHVATKE